MAAHLRSAIGWARGSKIGGDPSARSTGALDTDSQGTTVGVGGSSEEQQIPSLEPSSNWQECDRNDSISSSNCPSAQLNPGPESASSGSESLPQPDLIESAKQATTSAHSDVRDNIKNDLLSGSLEIPPFNNTVSAENRVTYEFPPALLDPDSVSKHQKRFDRSALLPDRNLPLQTKIMAYTQIWATWIAEIDDEKKREGLLDRVFEMATKAWVAALKIGYKPDLADGDAAGTRSSSKRVKTRRNVSPSRLPVLTAIHKKGLSWAVTAGELEAAGISEARIRRRTAEQDSLKEAGEELLSEVLHVYNNQIAVSDWLGTEARTTQNPLGRDLQVYCLYEVLRSQNSVHLLNGYYTKQKTAKQKEATIKRINEEQERQDLFKALALELEDDKPRSPSPPLSSSSRIRGRSSSRVCVAETAETNDHEQLESLVDAVERILQETNIPDMISIFEVDDISEDDIVTNVSLEDLPSSFERCKRIMREICAYARQWPVLSNSADSARDVDVDFNVNVDTQNLQEQIEHRKEILKSLVPSLIAERDAAKDIDGGFDRDADLVDEATNTGFPSDDGLQEAETSDPVPTPTSKRPLDEEESDEAEVSTPPTKKPKIGDKDKPSPNNDGKHLNTPTSVGTTSSAPPALNNTPGHSLSVVFQIPPGYDPTKWSSKQVSHEQGFSYRYTEESTLAQRRSMTDTLITYVRGSIEQTDNDWRFGKYHGLTHPDDPAHMVIIHGIWDLENGTRPAGFERFYSGNSDYTDELEAALKSDTEDDDDEPIPPPKRKSGVELTKRQTPEDGSVGDLIRKEVSRLRHESLRWAGIETGSVRDGRRRGSKGTHAETSKINNYGSMGKPKSKQVSLSMKQKSVPQISSYNQTISSTRPRRHIVRKNYAEEFDDDYEDEGSESFEEL